LAMLARISARFVSDFDPGGVSVARNGRVTTGRARAGMGVEECRKENREPKRGS